MSSRKVLGRGLGALIPQAAAEPRPGESVFHVPVESVEANPFQPRRRLDDEKLKELAESIKIDGVLQPVVVRRKGPKYELVAGERRLQAARLAGVPAVPVIVRDVKDADALRLALVENVQREDLNAIEEANAYRRLVSEFGLSQSDLAHLVGKDRSSVANTLRLLNLPEEVQRMVEEGTLTGGHARALLSLPTQKEQLALARRSGEQNLSVRQVESAVGLVRTPKNSGARAREKAAHVVDLERSFSQHLGTRVSIDEQRGGKGRVTIEFYSHDDFERLASLMHLPLPR